MRETAALLTDGLFESPFAKTAHGLVRGPSRYEIVGFVDRETAGRDVGEALDGRHRGIAAYATLNDLLRGAAERPEWLVIAIATPGGMIPDHFRGILLDAIEAGLGVVGGLHELLSEDAELVAAAARRGVEIIDIRKPKRRDELHFWSGEIHSVRAPRVAVLGTDCALGKRTTCNLLADACRRDGIRSEIIYTGQTGWLQGMPYGFVLDATPNDFVSGELEHAIVQCDRGAAPNVIFLEGQSSLRNPSGPCGSELLLSAGTRGVVLQHAPRRRYFIDQEKIGSEIPTLASEIELIRHYGAQVLGIALNHDGIPPQERSAVRDAIALDAGIPVVYPLLDGVDPLVVALRGHLASEATA